MKKTLVLSLGLALGLSSPWLLAQSQEPGSSAAAGTPTDAASTGQNKQDTRFLHKAAAGGIAEVELGQQALQQAQSPAVKQFAQQMVDDHSKANRELTELAANKKITVPSEPDASSKALASKLSSLKGDAYDKAYMAAMVKDHRKDVALFKRATQSQDQDIRQFAEKTLPVLEHHLSMAEQVSKSLKGGSGTAAASSSSEQ
ncbi:MAG: DUF4142 domain-containing protein [Fulvimonas sp.]|nr:DUF4142 domain-containing protein [Fulvimonas sp.]